MPSTAKELLIILINGITFQNGSHVFKPSPSPAEEYKNLTCEHWDIQPRSSVK